MNESKQRIAEYKKLLPDLKERVVAVALLLVISFTMVITTSFAWVVLSRSPEVTGVSTTVASNGNLEIALVGAEGNIPSTSEVGDSNKPLIERNITWGNLINLSDPIYGLDSLVLRPARLNRSDLLGSPLYGAVYGKDGRIEKLTTDFGFASWVPSDGVTAGYFGISDQFGVRAIASTKLDADVGEYGTNYQNKLSAAKEVNATAGSAYLAITQNEEWMQSLATLMGKYMTVRMNAGQDDADHLLNPSIEKADVENLRDMFGAFVTAFELEAEALAKLANFQLFIINEGDETKYVPYTGETLLEKSQAQLEAQGIQISKFTGTDSSFESDYKLILADYEKLVELAQQGTISWKDEEGNSVLNTMINHLVAVGSCTVQAVGSSDQPKKIDQIGAAAALDLNNKSCNAVITNGLLKRFEERTGVKMTVGKNSNGGKGLKIVATGKRYGFETDGTVYAIITTNAENSSLFNADVEHAKGMNKGEVGTVTAKDTYGLVIDLWVRTNAAGSYLTLQGNVLTKDEEVQVMGEDADGNEVEIYVLTRTDPTDSTPYSIDLYKDDAGIWYMADSHEPFDELEDGEEPKKKIEIIKTVIGYEGDNRVWDGSAGLDVSSTTQGSGSCYVYYADTPEDQARSLALLAQLRVAFVDGEGNLLAEASLDTKNFYAENGKVIVPLVLESTSAIQLGTDASGNSILGITALEQNVATRISAIVYLQGDDLTNADVLSSAEIQGKMNIQFGSTTDLNHFESEKLKYSTMSVSARITEGTSFDYDTATDDMITKVAVEVDGDQPKQVTAFFLRKINDTQGSREAQMTFTYNEAENRWEASHIFTAPGNYILRSVQLDGVEYDLNQESLPMVKISGFTIESVGWDAMDTIMTAEGTVTESLSVKFATDDVDKMPKSVVGQFVRASDQSVAAVKLIYDANAVAWKGNITFASSGEYTLTYLVLDGKHDALPENLQKMITIYLGMKVAIYTDSPAEFLYEGSSMPDNRQNLYMNVRIMDDTGNPLRELQNVSLRYNMKGSALTANGMYTELTWNASTGYYEGVFKSKVGMYEFGSVSVGNNTITRDTTSPEFMIISPTPPSFNSGATVEYQYAPDGKATLGVVLNNAEALPYIKATLVKTKGDTTEEFVVDGTPGADGLWVFAIPTAETIEGWKTTDADGYWRIRDIKIAGVFSEDGVPYTEDNPLVFDMTNEEKVSTKVVATIKVEFGGTGSQTFGKSGDTINGTFMQEHTIGQFSVCFTDFENKAIEGMQDVKIKLSYDGKSKDYGGYSGATAADTSYALGPQGDGKTFAVENIKLRGAGGYKITALTFAVKVGDTVTNGSVTELTNAPSYTVWSVTPSVKITARTSYGSSTNTDTSATVYFNSSSGTCGTNYSQPYVSITLYDKGEANSASLAFSTTDNGGTVHLYTSNGGSTTTNKYEWTANGACQRWVGYYKSKTASTDDKTAAGTLKATELTLVYDGKGYTVDITDITISNPS